MRSWKRYANVRATAVAGSIGAMLMVWAALFNRDQAAQSSSVESPAVVIIQAAATAAPTPAPETTAGATSAATATPAPTATPQPTGAAVVQPDTRTRGS